MCRNDLMSRVWDWGPKQMNQGWIKQSPGTHTVPREAHNMTPDLEHIYDLSLPLCLSHTHTYSSKLQLHSDLCVPLLLSVLLTAEIGRQERMWTIRLLEPFNIILNDCGKTFWLSVNPSSASVFLSELVGQGNQTGSGGRCENGRPAGPRIKLNDAVLKKKESRPRPAAPSLTPAVSPYLPLIPPSWLRHLTVFGLKESRRAGCGRTDQCHLCQGASQVTRAPGD